MNVPMALHVEYDLGGAEKGRKDPSMPTAEILQFIKNDIDYIKKTWEEV